MRTYIGIDQSMTTTLFLNGRSQAVRLPKDMRLPGKEVSIRRLGTGILIEPISQMSWPSDYFNSIQIRDKKFTRPDQDQTPPSPRL
jgi:antitoxin VapB